VLLARTPAPVLRPFVKTFWASDGAADPRTPRTDRERVLPTGDAHLVIRLSEHPLRVYDGIDDREGRRVGLAVVGGARARHYVRDVSEPVRSVGAALRPGAATLLFGVSAAELAERHTPLEDLWGASSADARVRLLEVGAIDRQLALFEALLAARLRRVRGLHPAVAIALRELVAGGEVRTVVERSGYSHRRFIEHFHAAVGLTPKRYSRVLRFQRALARVAGRSAPSWVDVALGAGYADQPHFQRDFREFSGLTPGRYGELAPVLPQHVPIPEARRSIPFKTRRGLPVRLAVTT
jgi:AraC-like DNA-binding protein